MHIFQDFFLGVRKNNFVLATSPEETGLNKQCRDKSSIISLHQQIGKSMRPIKVKFYVCGRKNKILTQ